MNDNEETTTSESEWPKVLTEYAHSDSGSERARQLAEEHAETDAQAKAIRGLGYEVELRYRVYEDGSVELLSCTDSGASRNSTVSHGRRSSSEAPSDFSPS